MARSKVSIKAQKEHVALLQREMADDVVVSEKNKQFKMEVGQSLFNLMTLKDIDQGKVESDDEIIYRINEFFKRCADTGQVPTIEKACVVLGMSTTELRHIKDGQRQGFSIHTKDIIRELYTMCGAMLSDMALRGVVNPVYFIFTAKNYFDMADKQELVVTPTNSITPTESVEVIEAKYQELPED